MKTTTMLFLLASITIPLAGCDDAVETSARSGGGGPSGAALPAAEPPREGPAIRGIVTSVEDGTVLIEENPAEESGSAKAVVSLTPETVVLYRGGELTAPDDLTVGHNVSAWFTGPVAESYPVQATAETIVIEPAETP